MVIISKFVSDGNMRGIIRFKLFIVFSVSIRMDVVIKIKRGLY